MDCRRTKVPRLLKNQAVLESEQAQLRHAYAAYQRRTGARP